MTSIICLVAGPSTLDTNDSSNTSENVRQREKLPGSESRVHRYVIVDDDTNRQMSTKIRACDDQTGGKVSAGLRDRTGQLEQCQVRPETVLSRQETDNHFSRRTNWTGQ
ncbi:hypothetical protein RRG08_006960 [Elysia crispata]|uniref:Uncharacterized protein n=1 Tax=Elysia crispata TaxID=231223 RepID=A0AAE0Z5P3_9GAST|nr:hypothetical protein RRG08_006960 [Elysia crispata]